MSGTNISTEGITRMTEMRDGGAVAFIGPDLNCTNEALVAAAWNLPMIAYVSRYLSSRRPRDSLNSNRNLETHLFSEMLGARALG